MTVFVVDDERPIVLLCTTVLELQGHTVEGFTRGEELLARLGTRVPDLLVVDYNMPGLGGLDVVRRARAIHAELRVLLITGHAGQEVVRDADAIGVNRVLLKPFTPAELAATVASVTAAV
jgi:two-component system C4-dicarboxylate transport response regulator DctD